MLVYTISTILLQIHVIYLTYKVESHYKQFYNLHSFPKYLSKKVVLKIWSPDQQYQHHQMLPKCDLMALQAWQIRISEDRVLITLQHIQA